MTIRYAATHDLAWLQDQEEHVDSDTLRKKIGARELIIAQSETELIGWLRYGFFWDEIPFMNMLFLIRAMRGRGIGRQLVEFWESEMRAKNYQLVMTSSQANEDAQHFYRKLGYTDCGSFQLPRQDLELIFCKSV